MFLLTSDADVFLFLLLQKKNFRYVSEIFQHRDAEFQIISDSDADVRPTQSIMYVPLQVNRFQKMILYRSVQYLKSCSGDFILQNLILRTRLCGTGFITQ